MTGWRAAALLAAAWLLAGCALLPGNDEKNGKPAEPQRPPAYDLRVEAPDALRELLEQFLDLSRFRRTAAAADVTDAELERLIAAARPQARSLLETEGYFSPKLDIERNDRTVVVRVDPGPRTTVDRVTIETQGDLQTAVESGDARAKRLLERLRRDWSLKPGEPFRQATWSDAKNTLLARLRASGYAAATWSGTTAQIDAAAHRARLVAIADSGPLFRTGELRIEGLQHHDAETVRNLADFPVGSNATETRLLDFQERLQTSSIFEGASVEIDPDPEKAAATPVTVRVREAPLQEATVGIGVSANTGPRVSLEHRHRRPFGWAAIARNDFELGRDRRAWDGELSTHTLPGLYRNLVAGSLERLATADEVRTSWRARIGRAQDTRRIDRLFYLEAQSSTVETATLGRQTGRALWGNYEGIWRDINNLLLPTRGQTLSAQFGAGIARSNFADSGPFGRVLGRLTFYRPLGQWFTQTRIEAGQIIAADRVGLPDTLLFRAGGDDSVRGYNYRSLGPIVDGVVTSGRVLGTASVEFARPILERLPQVWGAVFVDAGNAADDWGSFDPAFGYGVGVRVRSPIGPLKVDLAYGQEVQKLRLHFSVGVSF